MEAEKYYRMEMEILKTLARKVPNPENHRNPAISYENTEKLYLMKQDDSHALKYLFQAADLMKKVTIRNPTPDNLKTLLSFSIPS